MLTNTQGIVLKTIKYGDKNFICHIYTQEFGKIVFFIRGAKSKNKNFTPAMLQPASILDLIADVRELKNMHILQDANWHILYPKNITDIQKNCITLFMVDILNSILVQPEKNEYLFGFITHTLSFIEQSETQYTINIPIFFVYNLLQITGHDVSTEIIEQIINNHQLKINIQEADDIIKMLSVIKNIEHLNLLNINNRERQYILDILLGHFVYLINNFSIPESLKIIKKILYA